MNGFEAALLTAAWFLFGIVGLAMITARTTKGIPPSDAQCLFFVCLGPLVLIIAITDVIKEGTTDGRS